MSRNARSRVRAIAAGAVLLGIAHTAMLAGSSRTGQDDARTPDPVVARLYQHLAGGPRPIVLVVDSRQFPPTFWKRVRNLVAFRMHRPQPDGTTRADAAIYLVRDSQLYFKAARALRARTTIHEYVWCQLAAVVAHEAAHTGPATERQALLAEAAQLRRCLDEDHLYAASDGWNPLSYLQQVEARLRNPREHY